MSKADKKKAPDAPAKDGSWSESGPYRGSERVKLAPKPLKMDPRKDAPMEIYDEMAPHQLSAAAMSVRLDPKLDKNAPRWLQRTMGNVIYYLSVPSRKPLLVRLWHHRLRVPFQYAAIGISLALVASLFDFFRIYSLRGDTDLTMPAPPPVRPLQEEPNSLASMREAFNQAIYRTETESAIKERGWPNEYINKLEEMKDVYREKGLFMEWMAVKREQDRFLSQQQIFEKHLVKQPPDLRKLQTEYHGIVERYQNTLHERLLALYQKYISQLETLRATADKDLLHSLDVEIEFVKKMIENTPRTSETEEEEAETTPDTAPAAEGDKPSTPPAAPEAREPAATPAAAPAATPAPPAPAPEAGK